MLIEPLRCQTAIHDLLIQKAYIAERPFSVEIAPDFKIRVFWF